MGLKRRNKVSAEFSMSSLTDIIFLLLIFFMLTSTLVKIQTTDLPESNSKTVAPTSMVVEIRKNGNMTFNSKKTKMSQLRGQVKQKAATEPNKKDLTITIVAEKGVTTKKVSDIMDIAKDLRMKVILATQPKE